MKLSNNEFREILVRAQAGDNEAMTDILEMYMPLINKHSFVNGKLDEDLRQNILLQIVKSIKKFSP
ncbi:MAG: helix-turn-helix domain-containing protein [Clostridia bacterium]|nr:helix-turn-helix domain-containing protein [Clostridia bacterium]